MDALVWIALAVAVFFGYRLYQRRAKSGGAASLEHLPERFIVFDLETTGLTAGTHEIIEFGAIRVNRNAVEHETFQMLVKPQRKVPKKITELTGITQQMIDAEGGSLAEAMQGFVGFVGDLRLVSFNAEFDMAFLDAACDQLGRPRVRNDVPCALKMSRRAWPGRKSYRLADLARDGNLSAANSHRALGDCERALIVYCAASSRLRSAS
jgi:DNA polymerase III subunit epsilon